MTAPPPQLWKLKELVELAKKALLQLGASSGESNRVRWVPNVRLVRYYTTLGLLDRPSEMRGRTAFYGPRHLLQVLAVKRRQLAGHQLDAIQNELNGLPDRELASRAGLPLDWKAFLANLLAPPAPQEPDSAAAATTSEPPPFWERAPRLPSPPPAEPPRARRAPAAPPALAPKALTALRLTPGALLLLETAHLDPEARDGLVAAAKPLIDFLGSLQAKEDPHG